MWTIEVRTKPVAARTHDVRSWLARGALACAAIVLCSLVGVALWFQSHEAVVLDSRGNWRFDDAARHRLDLNLRHIRADTYFYVITLLSFFLPLLLSGAAAVIAPKEPVSRELLGAFGGVVLTVIAWAAFGGSIADLSNFLE